MRLTRSCKIDTKDLTKENKQLMSMLPDYDYARNEFGFAISDTQMLLEKLGQLEDIEDELGIDLITLFKAIYEGIYVKTKNGISKHYTVSLRKWFQTNTYCLYYRPYTHIWFKDYGKTWALTEEELL